jgi:hypothetical protein
MALVGAMCAFLAGDGPHEYPRSPFSLRMLPRVCRETGVMCAITAHCAHAYVLRESSGAVRHHWATGPSNFLAQLSPLSAAEQLRDSPQIQLVRNVVIHSTVLCVGVWQLDNRQLSGFRDDRSRRSCLHRRRHAGRQVDYIPDRITI